jgi:hypothetical protein
MLAAAAGLAGGGGGGGTSVETKNSSEAKSGNKLNMPMDLQLNSGAGNRGFVNNFVTGGSTLDTDQSASGGGTSAGASSWLPWAIGVAVLGFIAWFVFKR